MLLLKNGKLCNSNNELESVDILIEGNRIKKMAPSIECDATIVKDLKGKLVTPGLIDVHVHLREPGGEHKETILTGTKAAARGGFTQIASMPNTKPVPDNVGQLQSLNEKIKTDAVVKVLPYASITKRLAGKELVNFEELAQEPMFAFTDDGVGIQESATMFEAMKRAAKLDKAIVAHCEDNSLIYGGCVHDGEFAMKHDLKGIPAICESVQIARDVLIAEAANCHYHVCHVSTKESVRVIRDAKAAGIRVTAEVSPHHLLLNENDIPGLDTNYKMNPPLRGLDDQQALFAGLLDGTIDMIATDHAPHSEEEKANPIQNAPFGIVGLETAFPLLYTYLVKENKLTLSQLINYLTKAPASVFKLEGGTLEEGGVADISVFDLETEEAIDKNKFVSKGKNTPFDGYVCNGFSAMTIVDGEIAFEREV